MVAASPQAGGVTKRAPGGGSAPNYLIEFHAVGNAVKVSAIDPETGVEASIMGPIGAGREVLLRNAVAKLRRMIEKRAPNRR